MSNKNKAGRLTALQRRNVALSCRLHFCTPPLPRPGSSGRSSRTSHPRSRTHPKITSVTWEREMRRRYPGPARPLLRPIDARRRENVTLKGLAPNVILYATVCLRVALRRALRASECVASGASSGCRG